MLSSSSGVKTERPKQRNDNTDTDDAHMSPDVTAKDTAERGELQEIRAERSFRRVRIGPGRENRREMLLVGRNLPTRGTSRQEAPPVGRWDR